MEELGELDKFDSSEAEKLFRNIQILAKIENVQVPNRRQIGGAPIGVDQWFKMICSRAMWEIEPELLMEIEDVITGLRMNNAILLERTQEMIRRLLLLSERRDKIIIDKDNRIRELEEQIEELRNPGEQIREVEEQTNLEDENENEADNIEDNTEPEEIDEDEPA